jgi:hypothetical protein
MPLAFALAFCIRSKLRDMGNAGWRRRRGHDCPILGAADLWSTIMKIRFIACALSLFIPSLFSAQSIFEEAASFNHQHVAGIWQRGFLNGMAVGSAINMKHALTDTAGNIYIAGDYRVRVVDTSGRIWNLAGTGVRGYRDGPAGSAMFDTGSMGYDYVSLAIDSHDSIYLADGANHVIRKIWKDPAHEYQWYVSTYAGINLAPRDKRINYVGGNASALNFSFIGNPSAVTVDSLGNLWTQDYYETGGYYKITPAADAASPSGGTVYYYTNVDSVDGNRVQGSVAMAADALGNVYSLDRASIHKINSSGIVTRIVGSHNGIDPRDSCLPKYRCWDGIALTQAYIFQAVNIAVTPDGSSIYFGNGDEWCLRRVKNKVINGVSTPYVMTLHSDGWYTDTTEADMSAQGWPIGGPLWIDAKGAIYLWINNPQEKLGLRKLVAK